MTQKIEKRKYPRLFMSQPAKLRLDDGLGVSAPVVLEEISRRGALCSGALPEASVGSEVVVSLKVRDRFFVPRRLELPAIIERVVEEGHRWALDLRVADEKIAQRFDAYMSRAYRAQRRLLASHGITSPLAEAFRMVQVSLGPLRSGVPRIVLVTSAVSGEGKSFVSSGLAAVLAQEGHRVLLVDGDLYRPVQHEVFNLRPTGGVSLMLSDGAGKDWIDLIQGTPSGLEVLTSGDEAVPSELYSRPAIHAMCERLRASDYDLVILDSPPLLETASAVLLAQSADQVLLTVRSGHSLDKDVRQTKALLGRSGVSLLGVILNDCIDLDRTRYSGYANGKTLAPLGDGAHVSGNGDAYPSEGVTQTSVLDGAVRAREP